MTGFVLPDGFGDIAWAEYEAKAAWLYVLESGEFARTGYTPEWVQDLNRRRLEVNRQYGVCRYPECVQPAVWQHGPDIEHDGGWCVRFHDLWNNEGLAILEELENAADDMGLWGNDDDA
jgi:hypothetical protein